MSEEVDLAEDEVLVTSNFENMADLEEITIAGKTYQARPATAEALPSNYGVEAMYISFHSLEETERVFEAYKPYLPENSQNQHSVRLHFDIVGGPEVEAEVADLMEEITSNPERLGPGYSGITSLTRSHGQKLFYEIYGGLIFIGLIVSFILVAGTLLMLYFRQISQGQEDQEQFAIMKKVGLPDKLIRQTIASQVVWIFAMPLILAILHNLFASKIAIKLLGIFGSNVTSTYFKSFALVTLVFSLIYLAFYFLTSRSYYQIVNRGQGE